MLRRLLTLLAATALLVGISAAPANAHDLPGRYCGHGSQAVYAGGTSWMQTYAGYVKIGQYHYHRVLHDPAAVGWSTHVQLELCGYYTGRGLIHY